VGRWRRLRAVPAPASSRESQPQRQLTIFADVAIDELLQHCRHGAPLKAEATQYLLCDGVRDVLGPIGLWVEADHAQRIAMLAGDQVGDGGFIVGAVEVGLCERRAEPAVVVYDNVILGRTRNNRGP